MLISHCRFTVFKSHTHKKDNLSLCHYPLLRQSQECVRESIYQSQQSNSFISFLSEGNWALIQLFYRNPGCASLDQTIPPPAAASTAGFHGSTPTPALLVPIRQGPPPTLGGLLQADPPPSASAFRGAAASELSWPPPVALPQPHIPVLGAQAWTQHCGWGLTGQSRRAQPPPCPEPPRDAAQDAVGLSDPQHCTAVCPPGCTTPPWGGGGMREAPGRARPVSRHGSCDRERLRVRRL